METQTTGGRFVGGSEPHRRRSVPPPSQVDGKTHDGRPQSGHQAMHESDEKMVTGVKLALSWIQAGFKVAGGRVTRYDRGREKYALANPMKWQECTLVSALSR